MEAIAALNECGKSLISIREILQKATKTNPIKTDVGIFSSFNEYLNSGNLSFSARYAYSYIKLAENWDIVLSLGMQDTTDEKTLSKSMRLCRTLRIIDWYKEKIAAGWDKSSLTLDLYWEEQDQPKQGNRPSYLDLQREIKVLKDKVSSLEIELAKYKLKSLISI